MKLSLSTGARSDEVVLEYNLQKTIEKSVTDTVCTHVTL